MGADEFRGNGASGALVKIVVHEEKGDRSEILRALNRMNINHRSLFPDISGSAEFCNMRLSVPDTRLSITGVSHG